jgi:hypothetical protein
VSSSGWRWAMRFPLMGISSESKKWCSDCRCTWFPEQKGKDQVEANRGGPS